MTIGVRDLLDDCLQQKGGRIIGRFGSVRPVDNQSLALLASPCLPLTILIRKLAHFFCSSLLCTLLLPSSLYLPTYAIPTLPIVEGQHLHLVAVRKVSAGRMQPPSEQFSGPELPMAPPRPAIDARFYFESGVTSLARRDYIKAAIEFTEAIRLDRNFAAAYLGRGNAYSNQGNFDEAIRDYCDAIRIEPNYAIAYYNRGAVYHRKGKFNKALSDYSEAIRLDQNYSPAYNNRGVVYGHKGNYNRAISDFTEAIQLDPNYAIAYQNRGLVYLHMGLGAKANADFAAARRLRSP